MLDVLFSRWVFIHLSLHKSTTKVLGMPSPEMNKWIYFMLSNNKFLGKSWYGGHPWIRLAMDCERMVEKGINFIFCLGTTHDISSMESIGNYSIVFLDRKSMPPKMFLSLSFSLWALAPIQIPTSLCEGPFFYFMQKKFEFESPSSLINHQLRGTMIVFEHWVYLIFECVSWMDQCLSMMG